MSRLVTNTLETHNPGVDVLNILAAGLTVNGNPVAGGQAYPEPFLTVSSPTILTEDDQGIIFMTGGVSTLPATAPDGTTFKFFGAPGDVVIDSNGNYISGIGIGTALEIGVPTITLTAINLPGPTLIWGPTNRREIPNYSVGRTYMKGDLVTDTVSYYMSLADESLGEALDDASKWLPLPTTQESENQIESALTYTQTPGFKNADVCSTTNVVIASTNDGDIIDGVTLSSSIVLLTNQTLPEQNGLYLSRTAGGLIRLDSYQTSDQIAGSLVHVSEGTLGTGKLFKNTNTAAITVGVTPITYVEFALPSVVPNSTVVIPSLSGANTPVSLKGFLETTGSLEKQSSKFQITVTAATGPIYAELECTNRVSNFVGIDDIIGTGHAYNYSTGTAVPVRVLANAGTVNAALAFDSLGAALYEITVDLKYVVG